MNKPKVTDPSLSQQSIMSALCRTPSLTGLFNIDFLSSPFGHPRAAAGATVRRRWVEPSGSQRFVIRSAGQQLRQLGENHRYRGLPRCIASDFLFVLFFGEQLDYCLSVGFLGHTS